MSLHRGVVDLHHTERIGEAGAADLPDRFERGALDHDAAQQHGKAPVSNVKETG